MRIVQTFWSGNKSDVANHSYGWYAPQFHLMSWTLSALQLRSFYDNVILFTDRKGYEILIGELNLPYTEVYIELDSLNHYDSDLWVTSKIYTYSKQKKPFLHVDGDVFIWKRFENVLLEKSLIAQNLEYGSPNCYEQGFLEVEKQFSFFPFEMSRVRNEEHTIMAYNAGILGGSDTEFFQEFSKKAFDFLNKNLVELDSLSNKAGIGVFVEQYLFYCLAKYSKKKVDTLIPDVIRDDSYKGFGDFQKVPFEKTYLHLLGPYKKDISTCQLLSRRLSQDFPEFYKKVIKFYPIKYFQTISLLNGHKPTSISTDKWEEKVMKSGLNLSDYFQRLFFCLNWKFLYNNGFERFLVDFESTIKRFKEPERVRLLDIFNLENGIWNLSKKFSGYSKKDLFEREKASNTYFKFLNNISQKEKSNVIIKKEPSIQILETRWNWHIENRKMSSFIRIWNSNFKMKSDTVKTVIVPEVEWPYYSEFLIDELDAFILFVVSETISISCLKKKLRTFFNVEYDPTFSEKDLDLLLRGRLEKLIFEKCIVLIERV